MTLEQASRELLVVGQVQGLGVRPAIARLAQRLELSGFVANTPEGVAIRIQGLIASIAQFESLLLSELPRESHAEIDRSAAVTLDQCDGFRILTAARSAEGLCPAVSVPTDRAMCDACQREVAEASDRRCGYLFTSCTECGPRYSIIRTMPFERGRTSMAAFTLCDSCRAEYTNSDDRRFHAQTMACPDCGPRVWFENRMVNNGMEDFGDHVDRRCEHDSIISAAELIQVGGIVAIKGLGGYQLVCDATNRDSVMRLRRLKDRDAKPLAVMIPESDELLPLLPSAEVAALRSAVNPIVIVDRTAPARFPSEINPRMSTLGLLLPTTPLHALLLEVAGGPLVVTSGNSGSDPLEFDEKHATTALGEIADGWLHHNREIVRPVDDSVVRIIAGRQVTIRAARGIAPLPLAIDARHRILAVGGHQKVACAFSNGRQAILGPHLGDMTSLGVRRRFIEHVRSVQQLYGSDADVIVHDLHPDFFTTMWASEQQCRTIGVQHHHAHIVAGMVEHGLLEQQVLGLAFDGTGYGLDGSVWGGEFLLATATDFHRVGYLLPFSLPGGEAAVREPWRTAVSLLFAAMPELPVWEILELLEGGMGIPAADIESLPSEFGGAADLNEDRRLIRRRVNAEQISRLQQLVSSTQTPRTSSMGRLFDGVAALVLGVSHCSFEGELAMRLEAVCQEHQPDIIGRLPSDTPGSFTLIHTEAGIQIDWRPIIRQLVADRRAGVSKAVQAAQFHLAVALMAGLMADQFPGYPVVLSGGCFQNRFLTEQIVSTLQQRSRIIAAPGIIPPNDGGLAAGQLAIAAARLSAESQRGSL